MKKIGLSMRVDTVSEYKEIRDAADQRWPAFFRACGLLPVYLPSSFEGEFAAEKVIADFALEGIVLSGGNDVGKVPARDQWESALVEAAAAKNLPLIGVCRGAQLLGAHYGSRLTRIDGHTRTRHAISAPAGLTDLDLSRSDVNSYHNFGFREVGTEFQVLGLAPDATVEAFRHRKFPQLGILWHPERENPFQDKDLQLFRKFFGVDQ